MPKKNAYDYGCLMVDANVNNWTQHITNLIKPEDLCLNIDFDPIEDTPHITIMYGFDPTVVFADIRNHLTDINYFDDITTTGLGIFNNAQYDVLYLKIKSSSCQKANMFFKQNFKGTSQYPIYTPHMTLAYLKKGKGPYYMNRLLVVPRTIKPKCYRFTTVNGKSYLTKGFTKNKEYKYAVT